MVTAGQGASVVECPYRTTRLETSIIKDDTTETDIHKKFSNISVRKAETTRNENSSHNGRGKRYRRGDRNFAEKRDLMYA